MGTQDREHADEKRWGSAARFRYEVVAAPSEPKPDKKRGNTCIRKCWLCALLR